MTEEEWYELLHASGPQGNHAEIRAWQPGDGLRCSWAKTNYTHPCGTPVAVLRQGALRAHYGSHEMRDESRRSLICSRHVADAVKRYIGDGATITFTAEKIARETVLAAHWTEYQDILATQIMSEREGALSLLPESLRECFLISEDANA